MKRNESGEFLGSKKLDIYLVESNGSLWWWLRRITPSHGKKKKPKIQLHASSMIWNIRSKSSDTDSSKTPAVPKIIIVKCLTQSVIWAENTKKSNSQFRNKSMRRFLNLLANLWEFSLGKIHFYRNWAKFKLKQTFGNFSKQIF